MLSRHHAPRLCLILLLAACFDAALAQQAADRPAEQAPAAAGENPDAGDGEGEGPPTDIECLGQAAATAPADTTIKALRDWCLDNGGPSAETRARDALRARLALEERTQFNPFVLTPHRRNYILPWSYWDHRSWRNPARDDDNLQPNEVKFQISLKTPLLADFYDRLSLYGALTITSFWQAYNEELSKPFRETNYAPALFVTRPVDWQIGPLDSELISAGYIHESNGQPLPTSRSWDRLFINYIFRTGDYYWQIKPWYRLPESGDNDPGDPERDDNPNITDYMGNFELTVSRTYDNHVLELMVRNNLGKTGDDRGAVQIDHSFPLSKRFKGLFQVFTGYGDSLILYDQYTTRVSVGILLTDTL